MDWNKIDWWIVSFTLMIVIGAILFGKWAESAAPPDSHRIMVNGREVMKVVAVTRKRSDGGTDVYIRTYDWPVPLPPGTGTPITNKGSTQQQSAQ